MLKEVAFFPFPELPLFHQSLKKSKNLLGFLALPKIIREDPLSV